MLDADVIIRGEKDVFDIQRWVASRADDRFEVAAITVAELWHGVERASGAQKIKRRQYLETILGVCRLFPIRNRQPTNMHGYGLSLKRPAR